VSVRTLNNTDTPGEQTSDDSANFDIIAVDCLATYIKNIHYGDDFLPRRTEIFDYGIAHQSPCLKFRHINRILLYPGCFNPPHRGHFKLLCHGFRQSGRNICIITAIVLPLDNESLVKKLRGQENPLIFNKDKRVRLWKGYIPSDWY
jgi:hypothetical protein